MAEWFWIDGDENGYVPADDRGLAFADGVFETLRIEHGRVCLANYHQERLALGLACLLFPNAAKTAAQALEAVSRWALSHQGLGDGASLRLTVTRGSGPRGYAPNVNTQPRVLARLTTGLPANAPPAKMGVADISWPEQPALSGHKLLTRTEQVLAAHQVAVSGHDDLIMTNLNGAVVSATAGNVFFRREGALFTPNLSAHGIAGTRRRYLMDELASQHGLTVQQSTVEQQSLDDFDEAFICNSLIGIRSIASIQLANRTIAFTSFSAAETLRQGIHGLESNHGRHLSTEQS